MNNRSLYAMLGVIALVIVGLIVYNQSQKSDSVVQEQTNVAGDNMTDEERMAMEKDKLNDNTIPTTSPTAMEGQFSDESTMDKGAVVEVKYDGTAYTPAMSTIKVGDTVVFKNMSDSTFWPASAPHPQHTNYPEFDPKKPVASGEMFQFKFLKAGEWGFHDHLKPSIFGKIIVQ